MTKKKLTKTTINSIVKALSSIVSLKDGYHYGNPASEIQSLKDNIGVIDAHADDISDGFGVESIKESCREAIELISKTQSRRELSSVASKLGFDEYADAVVLHELIARDFIMDIDGELIGGVDGLLHHGIDNK
jgi:hypothetical protein